MNRIRSSRRFETESKRYFDVMWLFEKLSPDRKIYFLSIPDLENTWAGNIGRYFSTRIVAFALTLTALFLL